MNSSNSFNICPHCGNSNSLNARFCSRCGTQLKVPEEVVVCRTCGTRNSPMANFCRNCGSQLKVGEQTKICPKCRKEVSSDSNVCSCGYSFATISSVSPDKNGKPASVREEQKAETNSREKKARKQKVKTKLVVTSHKGGRAFAIIGLIFLLLFGYITLAPKSIRPSFLYEFDQALLRVTQEGNTFNMYGIELLIYDVGIVIGAIAGGNLAGIVDALGGWGATLLLALFVIFAISVVVHLIVCIVRIFSGKRSKKPNWCYLVLTAISLILSAIVALPNLFGIDLGFLGFAKLPEALAIGYVALAVPIYYLFFFLYSLIAKAKTIKEQVA